ncbi:N(G),N(G)-dimethylarginine dimethylaminohydrolase 1 [Epargyreus clarus]|uniref:N(G),N(G)-dimethylarginine dimethylaminohydrolase 1 n=1 Tax=Epargyreus clarus TaxID=520877 RepID=UPI003C2FB4BA
MLFCLDDLEPPFGVLGYKATPKMDFKSYEYTHVIVGKVPGYRPGESAGCTVARRQFDCYVRVLKELNLEVVEVDFGVEFPDNVFLEDLAIPCHGIVLLLKPTSSEEELVIKALKKVLEEDLGQTVVEVTDGNAKLAGSDVLFTGHEFFVGISETSNEAGASAVAEAFPEFPCTPIRIPPEVHHLKKYVSVAGPDILCVASCDDTADIVRRMEREANYSYKTLTVPEEEAANCLYVNGTLIHRAIEEIPKSFKIFCERIDFARRSVCFSELASMSTGLTACSLLVRKP